MIRSGIDPLDERLEGLLPGRTYIVSGSPGSGKSVACLEFINTALEAGETAAIVTNDDPADLLAQGVYLGMDLESAVAEERLILLRFQLDFTRRLGRAPSPDAAFSELRSLLGDRTPTRLVIDSVAPFLESGGASSAGILAMLKFLDELGATALLTYPGDLGGIYDRRLEPLLNSAAALLHLASDRNRDGRIEIRKVRYQVPSTQPVRFRIQPGTGMVSVAGEEDRRANDLPVETRRRLLALDVPGVLPPEFIAALKASFDVAVRTNVTSALSELARASSGAILVGIRRDTVGETITLIRELRRGGNKAPILLASPYTLRSDDRARTLRAGADDFLDTDASHDELLARIESAVRRGHTSRAVDDTDSGSLTTTEERVVLDGSRFREILRSHVNSDQVPFFTLITIRPSDGSGDVEPLTRIAANSMRGDGADIAGLMDDKVAVYLHSARRKDVPPYVERLRTEWRLAGKGELDIETMSYPGDEAKVSAVLDNTAA
jgi:KaiC/GvpD/RAD55 family RecA-like ATPase/DNA-binding NarL/FixJ family response regulator